MSVNFKPAAPVDLDALIGLMRELYAHDQIAFDEAVARRAANELLLNERLGRIWLIEVDGAQAGYLVLTYGFSIEFRSEEHTSELQSLAYLVCRLLLEKK